MKTMFDDPQFIEWIHDDITWCGNECHNLDCDRNLANRLTKGGLYSAAMFKGTYLCPLTKKEDDQHAE